MAEILETDRIDLARLEEAEPELRYRVVSEGRLLYGAGPDLENRLELRILREYQDLAPFRRTQRQYLRHRHSRTMVLDRGTVERRLAELDRVLAELRSMAEDRLDGDQLVDNLPRRWSLERGLLAAANLVLDVANHICAGHFAVHPATYEEALRSLAGRGVVRQETYEQVRGLGGFRNVLAREYLEIDVEEMIRWRGRLLGALPDVIEQVTAWLDRTGREGA